MKAPNSTASTHRTNSTQDLRPTIDSVLCPRLPALECLHQRLDGVDDSIGGLLGVQHLFGSTASLLRTIADGRISAQNVFLLGKPYSANRRVVEYLRESLGYAVHRRSCDQPNGRANDGEMDRRIDQMLGRLRHRLRDTAGAAKRVLLIDDGGRAIRHLHERKFDDIRDRFTCVEQTRAGIRALEDVHLKVPVINVAESWVKLRHESPMIAESVRCELGKQLAAMESAGIPTGRRALVIGYGAIGQAVANELRAQDRVVAVFDTNHGSRTLAECEGFIVYRNLLRALRRGGIVVGCTGKPVLDRADYAHIANGSILVSASSADVEFRAWHLRVAGKCLGRPEAWNTRSATTRDSHHPCFGLYRVSEAGRSVYLVNGGFPVNFNGGVDPIAPEKIQLTRSLLYVGAVQASRTTAPGIHELTGILQEQVMQAVRNPAEQAA